MARLIFLVVLPALTLGSCNKAQENAQMLDRGAICVGAQSNLLYCMIKGKPFICDNDQCLPAFCPAAVIAPLSGKAEAESDSE